MKLLLILSMTVFFSTALAKTKVEINTSKGKMILELQDKKAPETVKNFLKYVDDKYYDGTIFHRVISSFMIQGGGFKLENDSLVKKKTRDPIKNEAANGLQNLRGTIAMARTGDPHSATAQFFINHKNNSNLNYRKTSGQPNWGYAVFGRLIKGEDVLDKIASAPTGMKNGMRDVPSEEIKIISIKKIK